MRGMRLPLIGCVVARRFRAFNTLNQARRSTRLAFARSSAFATSPPSARRRTSSEAQLALRAGDGVAPLLLVRAVARPRHRACGGATARDARSWCCRAAHAALRVSSIVVEPDAASALGEHQPGEQVCFSILGGRAGASDCCDTCESSAVRRSVCVLQPGHDAPGRVKLVCVAHARFRRQPTLQCGAPEVHSWLSHSAFAKLFLRRVKCHPRTRLASTTAALHTPSDILLHAHARRHSWYRRRRIERHRCGTLRAVAHERTSTA